MFRRCCLPVLFLWLTRAKRRRFAFLKLPVWQLPGKRNRIPHVRRSSFLDTGEAAKEQNIDRELNFKPKTSAGQGEMIELEWRPFPKKSEKKAKKQNIWFWRLFEFVFLGSGPRDLYIGFFSGCLNSAPKTRNLCLLFCKAFALVCWWDLAWLLSFIFLVGSGRDFPINVCLV